MDFFFFFLYLWKFLQKKFYRWCSWSAVVGLVIYDSLFLEHLHCLLLHQSLLQIPEPVVDQILELILSGTGGATTGCIPLVGDNVLGYHRISVDFRYSKDSPD